MILQSKTLPKKKPRSLAIAEGERDMGLDELQAAEATRDQECAAMRSESDQTRAELQRLRQFEALCKQLEAEMSTARRIDDEMLAKSKARADRTNADTNAGTNTKTSMKVRTSMTMNLQNRSRLNTANFMDATLLLGKSFVQWKWAKGVLDA